MMGQKSLSMTAAMPLFFQVKGGRPRKSEKLSLSNSSPRSRGNALRKLWPQRRRKL
jgi:hypothetical protein